MPIPRCRRELPRAPRGDRSRHRGSLAESRAGHCQCPRGERKPVLPSCLPPLASERATPDRRAAKSEGTFNVSST